MPCWETQHWLWLCKSPRAHSAPSAPNVLLSHSCHSTAMELTGKQESACLAHLCEASVQHTVGAQKMAEKEHFETCYQGRPFHLPVERVASGACWKLHPLADLASTSSPPNGLRVLASYTSSLGLSFITCSVKELDKTSSLVPLWL